MNKTLLDIEVYPNFFLLGMRDYFTGELSSIEVSPWINQRDTLIQWLNTYRGFVISFNGIYYDNIVLAFIKRDWYKIKDLPSEDFCRIIKQFSDKVIDSDNNYEELKPYKYIFQNQWIDIDLFLYWSKGLRLSKKISLKGLGIQMNYPVVMELPYDPSMILTKEQIGEIKIYNLKHDLGVLDLLTKQFSGKGDIPLGNLGTIQLRQQIVKDYGIPAWSMDGPKIASEVLLKDYCFITGADKRETRNLRFGNAYFKFADLFKDVNFDFQTPKFQKVYNDWMNSFDTFDTEFIVGDNHPIKISVGIGGIE